MANSEALEEELDLPYFRKTGLDLPSELSKDEWEDIGVKLKQLDTAIGWMIGDWLNHGQWKWGEKYTNKYARSLGYEEKTLRKFASVSRRTEMSLRSDKLSFKHHRIALQKTDDKKETREWLKRARENDWSTRQLQREIEPKEENVHFSSQRHDWETPEPFFRALNEEFDFDLDVCATEANAKCSNYYTPAEDGLDQRWSGTCWMNPPYGQLIGDWVKKAYREAERGATVVCLIPSRTDTKWWHKYVMRSTEVRFVKGRIKFDDRENSAPFPSAVVIFEPGSLSDEDERPLLGRTHTGV